MKKIITLLIAGAMLTASGSVLAVDTDAPAAAPISAADDASAKDELNVYEGKVVEVKDNLISIELEDDDQTITFGVDDETDLGEKKLSDFKKDDIVKISSTSSPLTKDIKPAAKIELETDDDKEDEENNDSQDKTDEAINKFSGAVTDVKDNVISIDVETEDGNMSVSFGIDEESKVIDLEGKDVKEIKTGEKITVFSTSALETKDIKPLTAAVIGDNGMTGAACGKFSATEDGTLYNESYSLELYVEKEKASKYDGKTLLVLYDFMTMSIPAKTNPNAIIVIEDDDIEDDDIENNDIEDDDVEKPAETVSISFKVGDSILKINGKDVEVQTPYVVGEGHTLVPLRVISEAFGAKVDWNGETKTVSIAYENKEIKLQIANDTALVDGKDTALDAAPVLEGAGHTMVPLRFISETLGAKVNYNSEDAGITVSK